MTGHLQTKKTAPKAFTDTARRTIKPTPSRNMITTIKIPDDKTLTRRIYHEADHAAALERYAEITPDYHDAECARLQARAIRETLEALFTPPASKKELDTTTAKTLN